MQQRDSSGGHQSLHHSRIDGSLQSLELTGVISRFSGFLRALLDAFPKPGVRIRASVGVRCQHR